VSWQFSGRCRIQREAYLRLELRVGGALPLEAQGVNRGDRHVPEQRRQELAELAVVATHGQRDAIGPQAARAPLEAIFALREVKAGVAREPVQPLDLRVELL